MRALPAAHEAFRKRANVLERHGIKTQTTTPIGEYMMIWTPLFIIAIKMGWIDWGWWYVLPALVFDGAFFSYRRK